MSLPLVLFLCSGNFYRSRFAEELFNARARQRGLAWRATSAGLKPGCWSRHQGNLSPHALAGLRQRGVNIIAPRAPADLSPDQLANAARVVALCEREHRPLVEQRNPPPDIPLQYWQVEDIGVAAPDAALAEIESNVEQLLRDLDGQG